MGHRTAERLPELTAPDRRRRHGSRPWWRSRLFRHRLRRRAKGVIKVLALACGAFVLLSAVSLVLVAPSVLRAARDGRSSLFEGSAAVVRKDAAAAGVEFRAAREEFSDVASRLDSIVSWPLRVIPVVSTHVGVARSLATIGVAVGDAGVAVADSMRDLPDAQLTFQQGRVDLGLVRTAQRALSVGASVAPTIERAIRDMPSGWVGGPLTSPRRQALEILPPIIDGVRKAEIALRGLPGLLAEGGQKRYLVAFSNLSELRGSGGLFGYVTSLRAKDGDLDLGKLSGRPTEIFPDPRTVALDFPSWFPDDLRSQAGIFQNINMTTDFPTVGHLVLQTAAARTGRMDGVIAVDPIGIAAILGLTGPINVPTWHEEINAGNVAKIAMHDVYVQIPKNNERREAFFGELVRTAFDRLVSTTITLDPHSIGVFDSAVKGGHFRMFSEHPEDQAVIDGLGAAGSVARASDATDVLSVVSENATPNKADWYLRREVRYRVRLDPMTGRSASALAVTFRNGAPEAGLPDYIIGSKVAGLTKGTNRQIVMLLRSNDDELADLLLDRRTVESTTAAEGPLAARRLTIDVGPQASVDVTAGSRNARAVRRVGDERVYRLVVLRQPTANPDFADIEIEVPKGWTAAGPTRFLGDLTQDVVLEVRLKPTVRGSVVESVVARPWRALRRTIGRIF